uniref:Sodium-coupled monocarboxylate transporter 1 n=1 Tax=Ciona savignyi TaxID=51511 RepID=H2Z8W9_CIOSA
MLVAVTAIGAFYAYKDRNKNTLVNYYFGSKKMSPIPVGLSLSVTFISSITVLGYPAHAYMMGTVVAWFGVASTIQVFIACVYYIPLYHRLQLSSVYELLELRFHRTVRLFASCLICLHSITHMGFTMYLTALALTAVTPMSMVLSVLVTAAICTLYTTIGGMKAVVWTDTLQSVIMLAGSIAVFIKVAILLGGTDKIWEAVERGQRNTIWDFNSDPTLAHTFWTIVGGEFSWTNAGCCNQAFVQRYQSCETVRDARIASIVSAIPMSLLLIIATMNGCAMYAYYEGCDPMTQGKLKKVDQTVPYLVMEIFYDVPGMAGLFVSAAYSGMLSTVSSGINSVSNLILEDYLVTCFPNWSDKTKLNVSKLLGIILGTLVTCMVFITEALGATIIKMAVTVAGAVSGPLIGVYTLALFFPWINGLGAICGMAFGFIFTLWITIGGMMYPNPEKLRMLPLSADNCTLYTSNFTLGRTDGFTTYSFAQTHPTTVFMEDLNSDRPYLADTLYAVSYLYLGAIGLASTMLIGLLVSFITGFQRAKDCDPRFFVPFVDNKCLPFKVRNFFRFGVPELLDEKKPPVEFTEKTSEELNGFLAKTPEIRNSAEKPDGLDVTTV